MLEKSDLEQIRTIVKDEVKSAFETEVNPLKRDVTKIRKDIKTIVNVFDDEYLGLRRRAERLEEKVGIS